MWSYGIRNVVEFFEPPVADPHDRWCERAAGQPGPLLDWPFSELTIGIEGRWGNIDGGLVGIMLASFRLPLDAGVCESVSILREIAISLLRGSLDGADVRSEAAAMAWASSLASTCGQPRAP